MKPLIKQQEPPVQAMLHSVALRDVSYDLTGWGERAIMSQGSFSGHLSK
ncbi:hypothetical protein LWC05_00595 [Acetobacter sicerae]|uniref:Uncharacterized protein n=1 Tax=Acetobacter sicerae TaxID=85325 RepID=A0ABS8VTL0_9PROT|nr:hypothetical protein [Acetobacter sicerae]MCE0742399.1 hypothetical protein [Acetobacter sicerae]